MKKPTYIVTFRNDNDNLSCIFTEKFKTAEAAKAAIAEDAKFFVKAHSFKMLNMVSDKEHQFVRWVKPHAEDYCLAQGQDGARCYWQYFAI